MFSILKYILSFLTSDTTSFCMYNKILTEQDLDKNCF